jgi:hypothetical protein
MLYALKHTRVQMHIREVQHLEALAARLLWSGKRTRFWFREPTCEVERGDRWKGAKTKEVLAEHLGSK